MCRFIDNKKYFLFLFLRWQWLNDVFLADNIKFVLQTDNKRLIVIFWFLLLDEAQYKKFDEYAPKDSKSTATKKSSDTSNSQAIKSSNVKNSKRSNLKKRSDKTNYSHNWLLTTLKGHTGSVLDMSFSSNGKYLATCADGKLMLHV